ncbi:TIGR02234 family membrane protein [Streptomyces polyrhachis]|uniref:TIGR02234 family membrane protein n=1 Tax=Streptomyces polyrhachis TaxID=1282885 RepID=A0ABW2G795_9ACTN
MTEQQTSPSSGPAASGGRTSLAAALAAGALGAAAVLASSGRTWAEGRAAAAVGSGTVQIGVGGRDVTGLPSALAVVGLAALVAVFAVRGTGRRLVAALLALSGAGVAAASLAGGGARAALREKAAGVSGLTGAAVENLTSTAWPWVAAAGGLLLLAAGLLALRHGANWPAMSGRYERSGVPAPRRAAAPADPERPEELWKALDRGEDPTAAN